MIGKRRIHAATRSYFINRPGELRGVGRRYRMLPRESTSPFRRSCTPKCDTISPDELPSWRWMNEQQERTRGSIEESALPMVNVR